MCIKKSEQNFCLQTTLILLLVLCFILFSLILIFGLSIYFITENSPLIGAGGGGRELHPRHINNLQQDDDIMFSSQSEQFESRIKTTKLNRERRSLTSIFNNDSNEPFVEQFSRLIFNRTCTFNKWIVSSAILLESCPNYGQLENISDIAFNSCLRDSYFWISILAIIPLILVFISILAVCRLWICPVIVLALIYLLLALPLILMAILYKSGTILTDGWPLFIAILILVCLYTLLSVLHILLFAVATIQRRRQRSRRSNKQGDNVKLNDDDDELDDPQIPLYKKNTNGTTNASPPPPPSSAFYSNQKRSDFDDKIKDFKYIDDDMSYVFRRG